MRLWEDKDENDVLRCIIEAWRNLECDSIVNFHKYDRRHEGGVDIACQESQETINVQAKMKPRQKDIKQLETLSKSAANKKIYVYINQPSKPFMNYMKRLEGRVEFWDSKKLHTFLISNRSQLYLRYLFLDCDLFRNIHDILVKIFASSKINPLPLDPSLLPDWWDIKDRAVKLHASLEHLELFWKDRLLSQDRHDSVVLNDLLDQIFLSFAIISDTCSKDLLNLIGKVSDKQPNVLSYYVDKVLVSSPWIGMEQLRDKGDNPVEAKSIIQKWVLPTPITAYYRSEFSLISSYLRDLHNASIAIEQGVDFVFRDSLGKMFVNGP